MAITERPTIAFATFSPFKSWTHRILEWLALGFAPGNDDAARAPAFLHSAHFCPVSPRQLARAGLRSSRLKSGALLFMSYYNGDPETYFRGFNNELFEVMNAVWTHCEEWDGAKEYSDLERFIKKWERQSQVFFSAYPAKAKLLRESLTLRRRVDELLSLARSSASDEEFEREFVRVAQTHWGNAAQEAGAQ